MSNVTCPTCGASNSGESLFCYACGSKMGEAVQPVSEPAASPDPVTAAVSAPIGAAGSCPHCGTPLSSATQQFCAACGNAVTAPASVAPVAAQVAAAPSSVSGGLSEAVARFNSKMGTSFDPNAVGSQFVASSIHYEAMDEAELEKAFLEFNKPLPAPVAASSASSMGNMVTKREGADASVGSSVKTMADLDTSLRESGSEHKVSYGRFATGLSDQFIPRADLVLDAATLSEAEKETRKARLKRQVAMGEISQNEASEKANS